MEYSLYQKYDFFKMILFYFMLLLLSCNDQKQSDTVGDLKPTEYDIMVNDSIVNAAIEKGITYIESQGDQLDPLLFPILDYMLICGNHEINVDYKKSYQLYVNDSLYMDKQLLPIYNYYKNGMGIPSEKILSLLNQQQLGIASAFMCRDKARDMDILDYVDEIARDSFGYGMTHALLILQWMNDMECISEGVEKRILSYRPYLKKIAEKRNQRLYDLQIEAMAISYYINSPEQISNPLINRLITEQDESGGWILNGKHDDFSNHHPSILALWTLIGYQNRNEKHIPWINNKLNPAF